MQELTNLVLLSVSITTNTVLGYWKDNTPVITPSKEAGPIVFTPAVYHVPTWVEEKRVVVTNWNFGVRQGTNEIKLLVLVQP